MIELQDIARAALDGEALLTRSLAQDWLRDTPDLASVAQPIGADDEVMAVSASLIELFAQRLCTAPPAWAAKVGPLREPLFLIRSAQRMANLRHLCESESPEPMRRRRIFVPADYLSAA